MSTVQISAALAARQAKLRLQEIEQLQKDAVKRFVNRRRDELNNSFWRKLFRMRHLSYEQVEEMERSMPDLWANTIWEIETWRWADDKLLCERIILAAEWSSHICLSLEDAERLGVGL